MEAKPELNISNQTIQQVGLQISHERINANIAEDARIFTYPGLDNVYIMESDLYGNTMPKGSCFLSFKGKHGLVGKHLSIETLTKLSAEEIKIIIDANSEG